MATILLVENEPAILHTLRYTLEQAGYTVLSANCGESAIRICHRHPGTIDILISDVVMPGLTGFEVAAIVKSVHANVIVILMSGSPSYTFPQRSIANEFLDKPFDHTDLLTALCRHAATPETLGGKRESWN